MRVWLRICAFVAAVGFAGLESALAVPDGFRAADSGNAEMAVFVGPGGTEVRVKSLKAMRQTNSSDEDLQSSDARKRLEAGIYIMELGLPEITETLDDNPRFPMLQGAAYTEDGDEVNFAATWQGRVGEEVMVLVMTPAADFDPVKAQKLARSGWDTDRLEKPAVAQKSSHKKQPRASSASASSGAYPPPAKTSDSNSRWKGWHYIGENDAIARQNDKGAPRAKLFKEISSTSRGPQAALNKAITAYGVKNSKVHKIIETKIARQLVGDPNYIALGRSKRNGKDAVFFAQVYQPDKASSLSVLILEADKESYAAWGGIAAALSATGVIKKPTDIPAQYREQLANAPFDQQLAFYHMAYTQVMKSYFQGFMASSTSTVTMMQNMNYDLLFEGGISLETVTGNK